MSERVRGLISGPIGGLFALLVIAAALFAWKGLPFLRAPHEIVSSTPTAFADRTPAALTLPAGRTACIDHVTIAADAHLVKIASADSERTTPPLRLSIAGRGGYRAHAIARGGVAPFSPVIFAIGPPPRTVAGATICFRNLGERATQLAAAAPGRSSSVPSVTTVAGQPTETDLSVSLLVASSQSILSNLGRSFGHMAAFRPVSTWMVWLLALLAMFGIPIALGVAVLRAAEEDERDRQP